MKTLFVTALSAILLTACGQTAQEAPSSDPKVENQRITFPEKSNQLSSIGSISTTAGGGRSDTSISIASRLDACLRA